MVNYTIDEAIKSQDRIPKHVKRLLQERLDKIESGIKVVDAFLTDITWPRQVDDAFLALINASQTSQKAISEARTYAESTLNEAAGPVAEQLFATLRDKNISDQEKELLWSQLAGAGEEKIAQARAYRTKVVETAKANADYLQQLLPEYRKRPELVIQKIYQDAIEYVLNNADEKFIIQPTEGAKGKELRILVNKDPSLKPKSSKKQAAQGN
jgi:membrane protease subunit HflK